MRHVPEGNTWHAATDHLRGKDVYGDPQNIQEPFSIKFDQDDFNQVFQLLSFSYIHNADKFSNMPLILTTSYLEKIPLIFTRFLKFCQDKRHLSIEMTPYLVKNAPYLDKLLKASVLR